jgi:hypothetical protein
MPGTGQYMAIVDPATMTAQPVQFVQSMPYAAQTLVYAPQLPLVMQPAPTTFMLPPPPPPPQTGSKGGPRRRNAAPAGGVGQPAAGTARSDDNGFRNLYVSSLPSEFSTAEVVALFAPFGRVLSARFLPPSAIPAGVTEPEAFASRNSRGFAFVCFERSEDAARAMQQMIGVVVGSSKIQVRPSRRHSDGSVVGHFGTSAAPSVAAVGAMEPQPEPAQQQQPRCEPEAVCEPELPQPTPTLCQQALAAAVVRASRDVDWTAGASMRSASASSADLSQAVSRSISAIKPPNGSITAAETISIVPRLQE